MDDPELEGLKAQFPEPLRLAGQQLAAEGSVIISQMDERSAEATIVGPSFARTAVQIQGDRFGIRCDCPLFKSQRKCAHVWATLLQIARKGGLGGIFRRAADSEPDPRKRAGVPWKTALTSLRRTREPNADARIDG